ncbi:hypothetical protein ATANTOWER_001595 [Ataeniobius toweri]|uniref:Transmembrane protein n=1 Tax=Ataeniobius toweri TaxID=208326 RepID=A0ABU7A9I8_9TELE|nr:hypothetical protein [Ataeniobius toweri]
MPIPTPKLGGNRHCLDLGGSGSDPGSLSWFQLLNVLILILSGGGIGGVCMVGWLELFSWSGLGFSWVLVFGIIFGRMVGAPFRNVDFVQGFCFRCSLLRSVLCCMACCHGGPVRCGSGCHVWVLWGGHHWA